MIEVVIKCFDRGHEINVFSRLAALPIRGDIIEHDGKEYEVQFCSFSTKLPAVIIQVGIQ